VRAPRALDLGARNVPCRQPERDIAGHALVRKDRVVLVHHSDVARCAGTASIRTPSNRIRPAVLPVEACDGPQQGRLAAAGRTEQREELTRLDVEVDVVERRDAWIPLRDPRQLYAGHVGADQRDWTSCCHLSMYSLRLSAAFLMSYLTSLIWSSGLSAPGGCRPCESAGGRAPARRAVCVGADSAQSMNALPAAGLGAP
jgi:hypothetical protein